MFVLWAGTRGGPYVNIGHRRVVEAVQRQAMTVVLLSRSPVRVLFEAVSVFSTVRMSAGITTGLPPGGSTP
ncbi:hypothetical protein ACFVH6_32675 [Spirillospora sp. NPDC127200]